MNEEETRIPDVDKAWTAARAEQAMRSKIIPDAKRSLNERTGNTGDEATWNALARKAGEDRVEPYNPKAEGELSQLRQNAEVAIKRIEDFLSTHDLSGIENLRGIGSFHKALIQARDYLQGAIDQIDLGGAWDGSGEHYQMMHPKNTIPKTIESAELAIKLIEESEISV